MTEDLITAEEMRKLYENAVSENQESQKKAVNKAVKRILEKCKQKASEGGSVVRYVFRDPFLCGARPCEVIDELRSLGYMVERASHRVEEELLDQIRAKRHEAYIYTISW